MRILMTGAAGMIGRKLTAYLLKDRKVAGRDITALDLHDIVPPETPAASGIAIAAHTGDLAEPGAAAALLKTKPDIVFHLAGIVSGEAESNFDLGYHLKGVDTIFKRVFGES